MAVNQAQEQEAAPAVEEVPVPPVEV
jgi:hypothetical protein